MQVLDNLISNAVKFSPPKTTVQVRTLTENGCVFVAIKDHGPGISPDDQKKLFGKFVRLSAQPTGGESSTGLGLSIVKKLAEAMAGTVFCQSVLGEGATFILRLPAWDDQASAPSRRPASTAKPLPLALDSKADSLRISQSSAPAAAANSKPA
jgi:signal transduction histidine kinase